MATLSIGTEKRGKAPCKCRATDCVHKGQSVAQQHHKPVPANGPGDWTAEFITVPDTRDPSFTRKRHTRGDP